MSQITNYKNKGYYRQIPVFHALVCLMVVLSIILTACNRGDSVSQANDILRNENKQLADDLDSCRKDLAGCSISPESRPSGLTRFLGGLVNVVVGILVTVGFAGIMYFIFLLITEPYDNLDQFLRLLALLIGFLIYFGASRIGVSIPEIMFSALSNSRMILYYSIGTLLPATISIIVSEFLFRQVNSKDERLPRLVILITVFIVTMFLEIFVTSFSIGFNVSTLVPNISFVVGIGLYLLFRSGVKEKLKAVRFSRR